MCVCVCKVANVEIMDRKGNDNSRTHIKIIKIMIGKKWKSFIAGGLWTITVADPWELLMGENDAMMIISIIGTLEI